MWRLELIQWYKDYYDGKIKDEDGKFIVFPTFTEFFVRHHDLP